MLLTHIILCSDQQWLAVAKSRFFVHRFACFLALLTLISSTQNLHAQESVTVGVSNIAVDGEFSLRGFKGSFPYPVLSTVSVVDKNGNPVVGLAHSERWVRPNDLAEIGLPVREIWQPLFEYHRDNPSVPTKQNLYDQVPGPIFTEVKETTRLPSSSMLIMDVSSSMQAEIDDAKNGARLFVDLMRPFDQTGIIQFADSIKAFQSLTNDKTQLQSVIDATTLGKGTALLDAVFAGIRATETAAGRRVIIVYTDGQDNISKVGPTSVINEANANNTTIFTIAIGNESTEDILQKIAVRTGGLFFKVGSAAEMIEIYGRLSTLIRSFYLIAHSSPDPARNGTWRVVDISVNTPDYLGNATGEYLVPGVKRPATDLAMNLVAVTDSITIIGSDTVGAVAPGKTYKYRLEIHNLGVSPSDSVQLVHFLPDSVTLISTSKPPGFARDRILTWQFPQVQANSMTSVDVTCQLVEDLPEELLTLPSLAALTAANDSFFGNNIDRDTVLVVIPPPPPPPNTDLQVKQSANVDTSIVLDGNSVDAVKEGETFGYQLEVTNIGRGKAFDVTLYDILPEFVSARDFSLSPTSIIEDTVFWQFDSLEAGEVVEISYNARVADELPGFPFEMMNISDVKADQDTNEVNNSATTTVYGIARDVSRLQATDLAVTISAQADSFTIEGADTSWFALAGDTYTYRLTISNLGPVAAQNVLLGNLLPGPVSVGNFSLSPSESLRDSLTWQLGFMRPQTSISLTFDATVSVTIPAGINILQSRAHVVSDNDELDPANNTDANIVTNLPPNVDLQMLQSVKASTQILLDGEPVDAVKEGETYSYHLKVQNLGGGTVADVSVYNILPEFVTATSFDLEPASLSADTVFWNFDSLEIGREIDISFSVVVTDQLPSFPFELVNVSEVHALQDTNSVNNSARTSVHGIASDISRLQPTDVAATAFVKTRSFTVSGADTSWFVLRGETYSYRVTVSNNGPVAAQNVVLNNVLPASVSPSNFSQNPTLVSRDSLQWHFGFMRPGTSVSVRFDATVSTTLPAGINLLTNEALVGSDHQDQDPANNLAAITVTNLPPSVDLKMSQSVSATTTILLDGEPVDAVKEGDTYEYHLTVTNVGGGTAADISLFDVMPQFVTPADFDITPSRTSEDTLFWQFDSLETRQTIDINFRASVVDQLPSFPFALRNLGEVHAEQDSNRVNNLSETTVYGIARNISRLQPTDMSVTLVAITDSFRVADGDTSQFVLRGQTYSYRLTVSNKGPVSAQNVILRNMLPRSVATDNFSLAPTVVHQDSLVWQLGFMRPQTSVSIAFDATVSRTIPAGVNLLTSESSVASDNQDPDLQNNEAANTVINLPPNVDLLVSQSVISDTTILLDGETVEAVKEGEIYGYRLTVDNLGGGTAVDITLLDVLPGFVTPDSFSLAPSLTNADTIFWLLDSLEAGQSIQIAFNARVADELPGFPYELKNISEVQAAQDTNFTNNRAETEIYGILRDAARLQPTDVAIAMVARTDSFSVSANDTAWFARRGETYSYEVTVSNLGPATAQGVNVHDFLPDWVTAGEFQITPAETSDDSLIWRLGYMRPSTSLAFTFALTVAVDSPDGINLLVNDALLTLDNIDLNPANNSVVDTVFNVARPAGGALPLLEATPSSVQVGDSITIRVQVPVDNLSWDVWAYFANGQIDSTYANGFISANRLEPKQWLTLTPQFGEARLFTLAEREEIEFEIRTVDIFGDFRTARAAVIVQSSNNIVLDRNVFAASRESNLDIRFKLSSNRNARIDLFDIAGSHVAKLADGPFNAGWNTLPWNGQTSSGEKIGSGFYMITIRSSGFYSMKKVMVVR